MNTSHLNFQIRSYMSYKGQKTDHDYYQILFNKLPYEIVFKEDYYNLRLLYDSFKNYPNCNILTFEEVEFYNVVEFEFMLNLINDTKQIDDLRFKIINIHNYINELTKFIKNNHTIKALRLHISSITNEDLKLLCEAIKENDTLTTLDLSSNDTFSNIEPICDLIQINKNISELIFKNVYKCDFIPLIETLKTNNTLKKIKLYDTKQLYNEFFDMVLQNNSLNHVSYRCSNTVNLSKVKQILQTKENITKFSLYRVRSDDWTPLIEGLKQNKTITYLNLNRCNITNENYSQIYEYIGQSQIIKIAKLNHLESSTDDNFDGLMKALCSNTSLIKLDIHKFLIKDVPYYLKVIFKHPKLQKCNAYISYEYRQIIYDVLHSVTDFPNIGYQSCFQYKKFFESTDKDKQIKNFIKA